MQVLFRPALTVCLLAGLGTGVALRLVVRRLRDRHPEAHESLGRPGFWRRPRPLARWLRFVWKGEFRALGDPGLDVRVRWYQALNALSAAAALVGIGAIALPSSIPPTPTVSREVTHITAPLLDSGFPDYEAHLGGALPVEQNLAPRPLALQAAGALRLEVALGARLQRLETGAWPSSPTDVPSHLYRGPAQRRAEILRPYRVEGDRIRWAPLEKEAVKR